jgi:hypothetical protein
MLETVDFKKVACMLFHFPFDFSHSFGDTTFAVEGMHRMYPINHVTGPRLYEVASALPALGFAVT